MKEIPTSARQGSGIKQVDGGQIVNFQKEVPCWRINKFDVNSQWGASAAFGEFGFTYTEEIYNDVFTSGDEDLNKALEELNGKQFASARKFWERLASLYKKPVPPLLVAKIGAALSKSFFAEKIYPKLVAFEGKTWEDIERETYGKENKTKHHFVKIDKFIKEARDRIGQMRLKDTDELFSLRLDGKTRIYGRRHLNYMEIIWVDPEHKICPSPQN